VFTALVAVECCCCMQGEIQLPVVFENPTDSTVPSCIEIYRPVRQNVYAILYGVVTDGEKTLHCLLALVKLLFNCGFVWQTLAIVKYKQHVTFLK